MHPLRETVAAARVDGAGVLRRGAPRRATRFRSAPGKPWAYTRGVAVLRSSLVRLFSVGAAFFLPGAAFTQEPPYRLGLVTPIPRTERFYLAPDGEAPGLAFTFAGCDEFLEEAAGVKRDIQVWSTLKTPLVPAQERIHGWSISVRAEGTKILSANSTFAGKALFVRTEVTTGPGNEGVVSTVLLSDGFPGATAVAGGTFPIASMTIQLTTPPTGCAEARLRYEDGLRDSMGSIIRNEILSAGSTSLELEGCSPSVCAGQPGREICDNRRDDDGDAKIDLADDDCATFPHPGDCVLFDCGCHSSFDLFFLPPQEFKRRPFQRSTLRLEEDEVTVAAANRVPLAGFEVSGRTKIGNDGFIFQLSGDVADAKGAVVRNVFLDALGNRIPPTVANVLVAPSGQIEAVERGPDLEPFDRTSFLSLDFQSGPGESSFWARYLTDPVSSTALLPPHASRRDCPPHRILTVKLGPRFHRGDANGDGRLNISDPVAILVHLFGGSPLGCTEAGNADDDIVVNITDAVHLLNHLFGGGPPPPFPGPPGSPCGFDRVWGAPFIPCHVYEGCSA